MAIKTVVAVMKTVVVPVKSQISFLNIQARTNFGLL